MSQSERIVIVGAGLAGMRAAERLRELGFSGEVVIIGDEDVPPYHRPALSKQLLTGAMRPNDLMLPAYQEINASWRLGATVNSLLPERHAVRLPGGEEIGYDGLIIATGVEARRPNDVPYHDARITVMRTLPDALSLERAIAANRGPVAVVGGGFTGCEIAASLRQMGREVTIIGRSKSLLGNVLGDHLGDWLTNLHGEHGVDLALGTSVDHWLPGPDGIGLQLSDGTSMVAACVVIAAGTEPSIGWLRSSGLPLDNGVVCDPTCHVLGADDIVACGDVAQWPNLRFDSVPRRIEHWLNAVEMGRAAAESLLAGRAAAAPFTPMPRFWTEQYGVRIQAAGVPKLGTDTITLGTPDDGTGTLMGYVRDGKLMGVVGVDCPSSVLSWTEKVCEQNPTPALAAGAESAVPEPALSAAGPDRHRSKRSRHALPKRTRTRATESSARLRAVSTAARLRAATDSSPRLRPAQANGGAADSSARLRPAQVNGGAVESSARLRPAQVNGAPAESSARLRPAQPNRPGPSATNGWLGPVDSSARLGPVNPGPAETNSRLGPIDSSTRLGPVNSSTRLGPVDSSTRLGPVPPSGPFGPTESHSRMRPAQPNGFGPSATNGRFVPVDSSTRLGPVNSNTRLGPVPPAGPIDSHPRMRPAQPNGFGPSATNGHFAPGATRFAPGTGRFAPADPNARLGPVNPGPAETSSRLGPVPPGGPTDSHSRMRPAQPNGFGPSATNGRFAPVDSSTRLGPVAPTDSHPRMRPAQPNGFAPSATTGRLSPVDSSTRLGPVAPGGHPGPIDSHPRMQPVRPNGFGPSATNGRFAPVDSSTRLGPVNGGPVETNGRRGPVDSSTRLGPVPPGGRFGPTDSNLRMRPAQPNGFGPSATNGRLGPVDSSTRLGPVNGGPVETNGRFAPVDSSARLGPVETNGRRGPVDSSTRLGPVNGGPVGANGRFGRVDSSTRLGPVNAETNGRFGPVDGPVKANGRPGSVDSVGRFGPDDLHTQMLPAQPDGRPYVPAETDGRPRNGMIPAQGGGPVDSMMNMPPVEAQVRANGHTNGHAHTNGHSHTNERANGHSHTNGHTNGNTNGHINGHSPTNGHSHTNGHTNGHSHANGHTNGNSRTNGRNNGHSSTNGHNGHSNTNGHSRTNGHSKSNGHSRANGHSHPGPGDGRLEPVAVRAKANGAANGRGRHGAGERDGHEIDGRLQPFDIAQFRSVGRHRSEDQPAPTGGRRRAPENRIPRMELTDFLPRLDG